jgi:hypothetical protein
MAQNYKETLNLPQTDFPMKANLASREPDFLRMWEETRLYEQIQRRARELSCSCCDRHAFDRRDLLLCHERARIHLHGGLAGTFHRR